MNLHLIIFSEPLIDKVKWIKQMHLNGSYMNEGVFYDG